MNPQQQLTLHAVEDAVTEDFVALLVARNRVGPAIPIEDLLHRNAIPLQDFAALITSPTFIAAVKRYVAELTQAGFGVEAKSAVLHEAGLPIVYEILADKAQPALARLKAHEILGTVSGKGDRLRPAPGAGSQTLNINAPGSPGGAYQLVINLGPLPADTTTLRAPVEKLVNDSVITINDAPGSDVDVDAIDPDYAP